MTKTKNKTLKKTLKLSLKQLKSPTSLSIFPEKSPQLQGDNPSLLNTFTTKNVQVHNKNGQPWNTIENGKLAFKRSARGVAIGNYPKIIYGPQVERLTKQNYKKLKKQNEVYYDRGSVLFRGPFKYEKTIRGPNLLFTIKDFGYLHKIYHFSIPVHKLKNEQLFFVVKKNKKHASKKSRHKSHKSRRKSRKNRRKSSRKSKK